MPDRLETAESHVQRIAYQLLSNYRQCDYRFISSLELVFSELPILEQGQFMLIRNGVGMDGSQSTLLAEYLSHKFDIHSAVKTVSWEHCKAQLQAPKPPEGLWLPVAPWFIHWYSILDIIEPSIQKFLRILCQCEIANDRILLYRGESKGYPSVRSTLSRYWETTDPAALKAIIEKGEQSIRGRNFITTEGDMQGTLQHLGGKTNSIDFSGVIWIALYFACASNPTEDGVIWGYDRTRTVDRITVRKLTPEDETARKRAEHQVGWVVEPDNGVVPQELLHCVATVPKRLKPRLLEFLQQVGIEKNTMFPDIHKVIEDGQQGIPLEALVAMFAERLQKGDVSWVLQNTTHLLESGEPDIVRRRSCLYFRGLALAISGKLQPAQQALLDSRDLFRASEGTPRALQKNLLMIQSALKSRDISRIKRKIDYDSNDTRWYSESLFDYTFMGEF